MQDLSSDLSVSIVKINIKKQQLSNQLNQDNIFVHFRSFFCQIGVESPLDTFTWCSGCSLHQFFLPKGILALCFFLEFFLLCCNLYIPCLEVIIAHRFTCGDRKICKTSKKTQNIMKMIVGSHMILISTRPFKS